MWAREQQSKRSTRAASRQMLNRGEQRLQLNQLRAARVWHVCVNVCAPAHTTTPLVPQRREVGQKVMSFAYFEMMLGAQLASACLKLPAKCLRIGKELGARMMVGTNEGEQSSKQPWPMNGQPDLG